jgi:hypothetical protein
MDNPAPILHPDLYFRFFPDAAARRRWDNYFRYIQTHTELSARLKSEWTDALKYFRKILDENFLKKADHPITRLVTGLAIWQAEQLIDYSHTLQYLAGNDPDHIQLLNKLKSDDADTEAIPFLTIAHLLKGIGFLVRFPSEDPSRPNPDAVITDTDPRAIVYGEVSKLGDSDLRKAYSDNYYILDHILRQTLCNPLHSTQQLTFLPEEQQAGLAAALEDLRDRVFDTQAPADYKDPYLRITLFPLEQEPVFNTWLQTADRRKGLNGPPLDYDETPRIAGNKLKREARQIPAGQPGLIFIPVRPLYFFHLHTDDTIRAFQYRLQHHPNIIGVYLFAEILLPNVSLHRFGPHARFTETAVHGPLTRYSLFVRNEAYQANLPPETLTRINSIFDLPCTTV